MKTYPEEVINAFLTSCKPIEIQRAACIGKTKYYRLKNDPDFQRIVTERRTAIVKEAVLKMESYLSKDVEILQGIIENPETSAQTKINGINTLMNQLGNWKQTTEILERLEKLEEAAEGRNKAISGGLNENNG